MQIKVASIKVQRTKASIDQEEPQGVVATLRRPARCPSWGTKANLKATCELEPSSSLAEGRALVTVNGSTSESVHAGCSSARKDIAPKSRLRAECPAFVLCH